MLPESGEPEREREDKQRITDREGIIESTIKDKNQGWIFPSNVRYFGN